MTDQALSNAEKLKKQLVDRRKELQAELIGLDEQIGRADRFIKEWHQFQILAVDEGDHIRVISAVPVRNKSRTENTETDRKVKNSSKEAVAAAVLELIAAKGSPMSREELYPLLVERGLAIHGKDPQMVLSTMLWRMKDKVVRLKGGGYWDAKSDWGPAGYKSPWLDEISGRERDYSGIDLTTGHPVE